MKKVLIIHHQIGKSDGVSLEIERRGKVLQGLGCRVILVSGPVQEGADYVINNLCIFHGVAKKVNFNGLSGLKDYSLLGEYRKDFFKLSTAIEKRFSEILIKEKPDLVFVHNIFSLGRHPSAAVALIKVFDRINTKVISVDHDFYWQREDIAKHAVPFIKKIFEEYLLPVRPYLRHVVINTAAQKMLMEKKKINSTIMPDVFDFAQKPWTVDTYNSSFKKDLGISPQALLVLQATRIIPRKGIEIAIDFLMELKKHVNRKICLLLPNYIEPAEKESFAYAQKLKIKAQGLGIDLLFAANRFAVKRIYREGIKRFSLWDAYVYADLVTFPSLCEGWGNQFLEAVFAQKPIVVFEYPVFREDIKPEGYEIISLGDKIAGRDRLGLVKIPKSAILKASRRALELLANTELKRKTVEKNFLIAKKYHSFDRLKKHLVSLLRE